MHGHARLCITQSQVDAAFTVEMQLIRYLNRYSWTYYHNYAYCCDYVSWSWRYSTWYCSYYQCDNYFDLCIRSTGYTTISTSSSICTYGRQLTPVAGDDSFSFSSTTIGSGSSAISNPVIFTYTGSAYPVSAVHDRGSRTNYLSLSLAHFSLSQYYFQLFWKAMDEDGSFDPIVDYDYYNHYYPSKNSNYYRYMYGNYGGTNVYLYIRYKWYCPTNYYQYYCNRYCVYTNNANGHYSCDSNGYPVCLTGWTGTSTYCVTGRPVNGASR